MKEKKICSFCVLSLAIRTYHLESRSKMLSGSSPRWQEFKKKSLVSVDGYSMCNSMGIKVKPVVLPIILSKRNLRGLPLILFVSHKLEFFIRRYNFSKEMH